MSDDLERRVAEALWQYVRDDCMSQGTAERLARDIAAALRATAEKSQPVNIGHRGDIGAGLAAGLAALEEIASDRCPYCYRGEVARRTLNPEATDAK